MTRDGREHLLDFFHEAQVGINVSYVYMHNSFQSFHILVGITHVMIGVNIGMNI